MPLLHRCGKIKNIRNVALQIRRRLIMPQYPGRFLSSATSYTLRENQYNGGDISDNRRKRGR
jgi:transposase-like protein